MQKDQIHAAHPDNNSAANNSANNRIMAQSPDQVFHALGSVMWLIQHSDIHKRYPVSLLLSRILPPMEANQFKMFYNSKRLPIGFCAWARLNKERYEAIITNSRPMEADDWKSGDIPFIAELIAPFGHMKKIARLLSEEVFKGELVTSLKMNKVSDPNKRKPERFRVQKFQC